MDLNQQFDAFPDAQLHDAFDQLPDAAPVQQPQPYSDGGLIDDAADLGRGVAQGATLGFADEMYGAGAASYDKLKALISGEQVDDFSNLYRKYQQEAEEADKLSAERSPWLHGAGELTGGILTAIPTMGAGSAAALGSSAGRLGLKELAKIAGKGALVGGIAGAGTSEGNLGDLQSQKQLGKDIIGGAVTGGALAPAFSVTGKAISPLTQKIGTKIDELASENPRLKTVLTNWGLGREGVNTASRAQLAEAGLDDLDRTTAGTLKNLYTEADTRLGQAVGNTLKASDQTFDVNDIMAAKDRIIATAQAQGIPEEQLAPYLQMLDELVYAKPPETVENKLVQTLKTTAQAGDDGIMSPTGQSLTIKGKDLSEDMLQNPNLIPGLEEAGSNAGAKLTMGGEALDKVTGQTLTNQTRYNQLIPGEVRDPLSAYDYYRNYRDFSSRVPKLLRQEGGTIPDFVRNELIGVSEGMQGRLKTAVPEYAKAAERMAEVRTLFPETLLSKGDLPENTGIMYGKMRNKEEKLYSGMKKLVQKLGIEANPQGDATQTYSKFSEAIKRLEASENLRKAEAGGEFKTLFDEMGMSADDILKTLKTNSEKYAAIEAANQAGSPIGSGLLAMFGYGAGGPLGAAAGGVAGALKSNPAQLNVMANRAGRLTSTIGNGAEKLYTYTDDALRGVAGKLDSMGLKNVGSALNKSLDNKNQFLKNAAIFSILQNPNARLMLNDEE